MKIKLTKDTSNLSNSFHTFFSHTVISLQVLYNGTLSKWCYSSIIFFFLNALHIAGNV